MKIKALKTKMVKMKHKYIPLMVLQMLKKIHTFDENQANVEDGKLFGRKWRLKTEI